MTISYERLKKIIEQASTIIAFVFPFGSGNHKLNTDSSQTPKEEHRKKEAELRITNFRRELQSKISCLSEQKDRNFMSVLAHIGDAQGRGAGNCNELAIVALAYLYACCKTEEERDSFCLAHFYQPQYGAFGKLDHVFIVVNDFDKSKPLKDQGDDVYIYDPWLNVHGFFKANQIGNFWQEKGITDLIYGEIIRNKLSLRYYQLWLKLSDKQFNLSQDEWPDVWKQNQDKQIEILPIENSFIEHESREYDSLVRYVQKNLLLPDIAPTTGADEEERIAMERHAMLRTKQGIPVNIKQIWSLTTMPQVDLSGDEEAVVCLEERKFNIATI